jgi:hypothetical protein
VALDINDLIRGFEPILYFADGERFFPSDCKRYLERSALWNAMPPFDDHNSWRRNSPGTFPKPLFFPRALSARSDEPGQFLGEQQGGSFPFLFASGADEGFLDLTGWTDGLSVTPTSNNRFANLDEIETLYNSSSPAAVDPLLQGSRFWYHAEVFDAPRLRQLMSRDGARAEFKEIFPRLIELTEGAPVLLCYYLFFPGHDEPLEQCEDVAEAALFGSYSGEWACVSLLLKARTTDVPVSRSGPTIEHCVPVAIGLSSRNVGDVGFLGGERRVGMTVHPWDGSVDAVTRDRGLDKQQGFHARLFVAKGTHGLYLRESFLGEEVPFFSPEDSARQHCGAAELLDKSLEELDDEAEEKSDDVWVDDSEVFWLKALVNFLWAGIEFIAGGGGGFTGAGTRTPDQFDHPPMRDAPEYFSTIIHPAGVIPPKGDKAVKVAWQFPLSNEAALETKENNLTYSMRVDRINPNPVVRQVWWPGIQGFTGYAGRWGTRVARDPKARRAGMKFPEFWELFMSALAKSKGT